MSAACIKARVSLAAVYKERDGKPEFAKAWDEAIKQGVEYLESVVWDRRPGGVSRGVRRNDANGDPVKVETIHEFSDSLAVDITQGPCPAQIQGHRAQRTDRRDGQAMVVIIQSPVNPEDVTGPAPVKKEPPMAPPTKVTRKVINLPRFRGGPMALLTCHDHEVILSGGSTSARPWAGCVKLFPLCSDKNREDIHGAAWCARRITVLRRVVPELKTITQGMPIRSLSHTSATDMGTDWRDNDPDVEPVGEIYQGMRQNYEMPDAPRSNSAADSIGGWRPKGFVNLALEKGYKLGFQASSDHISTHQSYANVLVTENTREAILDALRKRHVYASTEQIVADVRSGPYLMGDIFSTAEAPSLHVKLAGTTKFSKVVIVKDNEYVYSTEPASGNVEFSWRDNAPVKGKTSYYYVRGEQENGELVWVSPMWITYTGR